MMGPKVPLVSLHLTLLVQLPKALPQNPVFKNIVKKYVLKILALDRVRQDLCSIGICYHLCMYMYVLMK